MQVLRVADEVLEMNHIKPIQTVYKGYRFRSRLEARWAVFFDAMKIEWEYEPEGFVLSDGTRYLPDFWLPQVNMWAEVKADSFSEGEIRKCRLLATGTGYSCLMLNGMPDARNFWACEPHNPYYRDEFDPDLWFMDYVLTGRDYWLSEGRFYCCSGASYPEQSTYGYEDAQGIIAARRARFEYGETPDV